MALGSIIVEAAERSGSLITARQALEQGREVFAIPGSIFSETSKGVHSLIQSGAKLVQSVEDILRELLPQIRASHFLHPTLPPSGVTPPQMLFRPTIQKEPLKKNKILPEMTADVKKIYDLLSDEPKQINTLIEESSLGAGMVSYHLLELELQGVIRQITGQFYVRT